MKKLLLSLGLLTAMTPELCTSTYASPFIHMTQVEVKNSHKGMCNVFTYDEKGNILHSGNGFFINENGTGVAAYSLFKEAYKAVVVDYKGNQLPVTRILGANSTYDLVKFSTKEGKSVEAFDVTALPEVTVGTPLQMVHYTGKKKSKPIEANIESADAFKSYHYYQISVENIEKNFGCPLVDNSGNVVAIVQKNVEEKAEKACAIDARFINELKISGTSILNSDLNDIHISKGLPPTEKDALTYLYMLGTKDSTAAINAINDFIDAYPENAEGYNQRGAFYAQYNEYERCEEDFKVALEVVEKGKSTLKADEIHNNLSKLIYNKVVYNPQSNYDKWTLDLAIEEADQAYQIVPSPFYLLQKGHCFLAKKEYMKAYEYYKKINSERLSHNAEWSDNAKAEAWIFAARAYEMNMKEKAENVTLQDSLEVIALLDSAIAAFPQPYTLDNAHFFLERAQRNEDIQQFRKAVFDYNEYEKIIGPRNLNDKFYYLREQAEMKSHMYQQALDDINTAIAFNPKEPFYPVEKGVILLQVGMYEEAIATCKASLETLPENPDCYKIIGISYGELKNRKEALNNLKKAQELGDPTVQTFIEKYQ